MNVTASLLGLALASAAFGVARAASSNFEYNNPSPFTPGQPAQPNLAQIHDTQALTDTIKTYIAYPAAKTKVVVAILDGRADYTHIDLSGHETDVIVYSGLYAGFDNHATHVSGIIGAAENGIGIAGVDPFSTLLDIPVFDSRGWVATDLGKKALDTAQAAGARVVNMSYGPTVKGDVFLDGELNLFQSYNSTTPGKGMVLVRAAGNDGVNAINEAFSGNASSALSNLLIVGSVNAKNVISSFSNRPGSACIGSCGTNNINATMNFFLVAPGENIISDLPSNYIGLMSGTSMAAPEVTGAAALVFQKALAGNTQLTPGQVAQILKLSADDLGAPGVDAVYGWGLLDVARALNPVGTLSFPTGSGATSGLVVVSSSSLSGSSSIGKSALQGALTGMIALDGFGRAFVADPPALNSPAKIYATNFLEELSGDVSSTTTALVQDGHSIGFLTSSGEFGHGGSRTISLNNGDLHIASGLGQSLSYFTSVQAPGGVASQSYSYTMARDFFTGSGDAALSLQRAMFFASDVKTGSRLTLSSLILRTTPASFDNVPDNISAVMLAEQHASSLVKLGANYRIADGISVGVSYGLLQQHGETLGMQTTGAFSLGDGLTYITSANLNADITPTASVMAFAEHSTTEGSGGRGGLLTSDNWGGSKYGLGITQSGAFGSGGSVRLTLSRPWVIDSGTITAHIPVGRELDGTIDFADRVVPVADRGTPLEVGLAYLWGGNALKYGAEVRMLDHDVVTQSFSDVSLAGALRWNF